MGLLPLNFNKFGLTFAIRFFNAHNEGLTKQKDAEDLLNSISFFGAQDDRSSRSPAYLDGSLYLSGRILSS